MSPGEFFRSRIDSLRAHPFQNAAGAVLGGFIPGGGLAANAFFNRYNDNQFNNAAQTGMDRSLQQTTMDANSAMTAPLNDPRLNQFDNMGGSQGRNAGQDRQLVQALTGGGNPGGQGINYSNPGAWSPQSYSGWNPNQANAGQAFGLLDFLGQSPAGQSGPMNHQDHINALAQGNGGGMPGNYGVSNFNVGGSPVIFGTQGNDMNGLAMANRRMWDH